MESNTESDSDTESEMSENGNLIQEDYNGDAIEDESSDDIDARAEKFVSMMQSAMDLFNEQKFVERFMATNKANNTRMTAMQKTWAKYRHPATMYFK
jgi:uncharacterized protein (DUF2384 family)